MNWKSKLINLLGGISEQDLDRVNQELKKAVESQKNLLNKYNKTVAEKNKYLNLLESIPYKLDEMKISRQLRKAILNKILKG